MRGELSDDDIRALRKRIPTAKVLPDHEKLANLRKVNHKLVAQRNALRTEIAALKKDVKQLNKRWADAEKRAANHPAQPPFGPQLPRIVVKQWELPQVAETLIDICKRGVHTCCAGYKDDMAQTAVRYRTINEIMAVFDQIAGICKGSAR